MSIDQQGGTVAEHVIGRFARRAHELLDSLVDAPAGSMTPTEAADAVTELTRLCDRVTELRLRVLAAADTLEVGATGCTSTPAWLAARTQVTRPQAHADLRLALELERSFEATRTALAAGDLHEDQARVIVHAIGELPDEVGDQDRRRAEAHLLRLARVHDAKALRGLGRRLFEVIAPCLTAR